MGLRGISSPGLRAHGGPDGVRSLLRLRTPFLRLYVRSSSSHSSSSPQSARSCSPATQSRNYRVPLSTPCDPIFFRLFRLLCRRHAASSPVLPPHPPPYCIDRSQG